MSCICMQLLVAYLISGALGKLFKLPDLLCKKRRPERWVYLKKKRIDNRMRLFIAMPNVNCVVRNK